MPPAKRSGSRGRSFKEPAALKRFNKSLESAERALSELGKQAGRDVGKGAGDLYKDLRKFVTTARRDSGKLTKALQRDFEQAEKRLTQRSTTRRTSTSRTRSTSARARKPKASGARSRRKTS